MNPEQIEAALALHSRDTGIPVKELKRLCLRAGLELLQQGALTVTKGARLARKGGVR